MQGVAVDALRDYIAAPQGALRFAEREGTLTWATRINPASSRTESISTTPNPAPRKLDCSEAQLREAVKAVGNQAGDVEMHLHGVHSTTNSDRVHDADENN